jgi:hypothetical protein
MQLTADQTGRNPSARRNDELGVLALVVAEYLDRHAFRKDCQGAEKEEQTTERFADNLSDVAQA